MPYTLFDGMKTYIWIH